jgi:hypothetical protein
MHDIGNVQQEHEWEQDPLGSETNFEALDSGQELGGEQNEMDLASELLEVGSEEELDQFFGKFLKRFSRSGAGRALGGMLKQVAKKALPIAGGAVGGMFGGPLGAKLGSQLASSGGQMFGLELEGLSADDAEFEVARRVTRLAGDAAARLAHVPAGANPTEAAKAALAAAARRHAPGLAARIQGGGFAGGSGAMSGRWVRRGNRIILYGI